MTKENLSLAREHAIKFLYQCETEKIYYFSKNHLESYFQNFNVSELSMQAQINAFCQGTFDNMQELDKLIEAHSKNWPLKRMAATDRAILRLACFELTKTNTPVKVVLNEAIELAKLYGTEHSSKFVNGILDGVAKKARQT